jgi:general secretion pathway protein K
MNLKQNRTTRKMNCKKHGAALIVVMWVLVIVSLIVSSFAFEMQMESRLITAARKRMKADQLALAGIELAKCMLAFEEESAADEVMYEDPYLQQATKIRDGVPVRFSEELGDGTVTLGIDYERGRLPIHKMVSEDWKALFDQMGIPLVEWDTLIGCLTDWQDENDLKQLNGAESDDAFYRERGYKCKNAPLDTVDELLLIKGWKKEYLYGTPPDEEVENPITGMIDHLTIWGDGKINPNSASRETLQSIGLPEGYVDAILDAQVGFDGEPGTEDDGLTPDDFVALGLNPDLFDMTPQFVRIESTGEVGGIRSSISAIFKLGGTEPSPLFWLEGNQ